MEALQMGVTACKYIHELQKDALKREYTRRAPEAGVEDEEYDDDLETDLGEAELIDEEDE
jgi:hypothetical protein